MSWGLQTSSGRPLPHYFAKIEHQQSLPMLTFNPAQTEKQFCFSRWYYCLDSKPSRPVAKGDV